MKDPTAILTLGIWILAVAWLVFSSTALFAAARVQKGGSDIATRILLVIACAAALVSAVGALGLAFLRFSG